MINRVTLVGNLGKDPEIRHFENGGSVARITVATNESYKDKDGNWQTQTEWHNVVAWRANAERAERELKKGSMVLVEGKLKTRGYKDQNGLDKTITEVEATLIKSLEKRERTGEYQQVPLPESGQQPPSYSSNAPSQGAQTEPDPFNGASNGGADDLPF